MKRTIARFESTEDTFTRMLQAELDIVLAPLATRANVVQLSGAQASRDRLQTAIASGKRYFLIAAMGHGDEESFSVSAPNKTEIFSTDFKAPEVRGAIVHILSCFCALKLGPALVTKQQAAAFIGYSNYFTGPKDLTLLKHYVAQTAAINLALVDGGDEYKVQAAARKAHAAARAKLETEPTTASYDLAAFDANEEFLVGPWTHRKYGRIGKGRASRTATTGTKPRAAAKKRMKS